MKNKLLLIVLTVLLSTTLTLSQTSSTGRLSGTVAGPDGVLPGATILVKDNQTGREYTLTSNSEGVFNIPSLEVGTYTVTVTVSGFKTFTAEQLKIDVGREFNLGVNLEVGGVTENVTITAGADVVNSSGADLSSTVSPRQVLELPLNGRNPLSLIGLQAGATQNRGNGGDIINGGRTSTANYTRDGINVADPFIRNGASTDNPSVDNTGEFTVIAANAGAEYGYGSSQIQLVTPRGGRGFHGALWEYNRNSYFAANSFFNKAAGLYTATSTAVIQGRANVGDEISPRAFLNRNQYGGKISGPMPMFNFGEGGPVFLKDKAFFFFSTERLKQAQQFTATRTIFRQDARNGIFSYRPTGTPAAGQCLTFTNGICRVNVLSGAGLINNTIPASAQGPLALDSLVSSRFLANIPIEGNRPDLGDGLNTIGYQFTQSAPQSSKEYTTRIDLEVNNSNSIYGVYRFNDTFQPVQDTSYASTYAVNYTAPTHSFTVNWNSNISSNFSNSLRGGVVIAPVAFANQFNDYSGTNFFLSIPLVNSPENVFRDQGRDTKTYNLADNATYIAGNHVLRFGADTQRISVRAYNFAGIGIPTYAISTTGNPNTPGLIGGTTAANVFPGGIGAGDLANANALRYLLGGIVGSGSVAANVTGRDATAYTPGAKLDRNLAYDTYSAYFADQWRVKPNLTLNLGIRYEYYTPLRSTDGLYLEPVCTTDDLVACVLNPNGTYDFVGGNSGSGTNFTKRDLNNFGPVVSFAWSPKGGGFFKYLFGENRTVIRGGYRMGYVNDEYIKAQDNAGQGSAGLSATASAVFNNSTFLNDRASATLSPTVAPAFVGLPRSFASNNTVSQSRFGTVFLVDPNLQVQREHEYNIGIQREIGWDTVFEIRYVGTYSNQLTRTIDYNQVDIRKNGFLTDYLRAYNNNLVSGSINGNAVCLAAGTCQALTVIPNLAAAGRTTVQSQIGLGTPAETALSLIQAGTTGTVSFLANPNTGVANVLTNGGRLRYNALQTEIRRRFTDGLSLQANYTFQKILTDITDDGINQNRVNPYLDNENPDLDYSRAPYDTAHSFNLSVIYELPFGRGKSFLNSGGVVNQIFGGWQVGSIVQWNSGAPITFLDARGTLNRAARSNNQTARTSLTKEEIKNLLGFRNVDGRLYYIDPSVISTAGRGANGFGTTPFTGQVFFNNNPGETGNVERYAFNGPQYWNWDANILKNFSITETTRIQFRAEAFNVTNSTRFGAPTFNVNSTSFGRITSAYSPRIMQFALRFEF